MSHDWVTLYRRYGQSVRMPSEADLLFALKEVLSAKDEEHPDTWIECGTEKGPLHTFSVSHSGYGTYARYSDVDMSQEVEHAEYGVLDLQQALKAWHTLISTGSKP
jgi:hypothetical protein